MCTLAIRRVRLLYSWQNSCIVNIFWITSVSRLSSCSEAQRKASTKPCSTSPCATVDNSQGWSICLAFITCSTSTFSDDRTSQILGWPTYLRFATRLRHLDLRF
eukprot:g1666.t1